MRLAPIRITYNVAGQVGYSYLNASSGRSGRSTAHTLGMSVDNNIRIKSFIWQPWFALVSSNLHAAVGGNKSKRNSDPALVNVAHGIGGEANLNLLQKSRFPFDAHIFNDSSRQADFDKGSEIRTLGTGYSLNQSYRTRNSRIRANASFTSTKSTGEQNGVKFSPSFGDSLSFSFGIQPARFQNLSLTGSKSWSRVPDKERTSVGNRLISNYAYRPNNLFSLASMANLSKSDISVKNAQQDNTSGQFMTYASMRPEDSPLTVTSSVRIQKTEKSINGKHSPALKQSHFNLGANYLFSKLIRMYGSVNVSDIVGVQTVSTSAALSASKPYSLHDRTVLGGYRYNGTLGGSISSNNSTKTDTANQATAKSSLNIGLRASHELNKSGRFGSGNLSKNLHQSIGTSIHNGDNPTDPTLGTGGSLSWNKTGSKGGSTRLSLNATDSRRLGGQKQSFQMINLQGTRYEPVGRNVSFSGNFTLQGTHQESQSSSRNTLSPSAAISYSHKRAFNVKNLAVASRLHLSDTNILPGESLSTSSRSWTNSASYKIGELSLSLSASLALSGTYYSNVFRFSMQRNF